MPGSAVSQNYAEALFELAEGLGQVEPYLAWIDLAGWALGSMPQVQSVLVSPRVTKSAKGELISRAFSAVGAPPEFVRYLQAVVRRGRQNLLQDISSQYAALVDQKFSRVRANVTVARIADPQLERAVIESLGKMLNKEIVVNYTVDPAILGGAIIRVGDRVFDGSIRRRLVRLKRHLLSR